MSLTAAGEAPAANRGGKDIAFAVGIVLILCLFFLPVPAFMIDFGLALSIALAVLILMVALWIHKPLEFSAFPTVLLVAVRRPDGRRDALLVNYGCHPVVLGPSSMRISADYVGYMKDYLEARGAAGTAMFALAGGGNINPRVCIMVGAEHPRRMGERLGQIVLDAAAKLYPVAAGPVRVARSEWKLRSKRNWSKGSGRETGKEIVTEVQALRAGDLCFLAVPGELFSEFAAWFREASPLPLTAVVSIANDSVGYLPTDEAVPQGGHEVMHAAAEKVQEALLSCAKEALGKIA